jgi:hypothetical protein
MTLHPKTGESLPELVTVAGQAVLEEAEGLREVMASFSAGAAAGLSG